MVCCAEQLRGQAVVEQVFAEFIAGPLAHLPSGVFDANNAWLTCIAIAQTSPAPPPRWSDAATPPSDRPPSGGT
jgi:hypothetical protein